VEKGEKSKRKKGGKIKRDSQKDKNTGAYSWARR